jgi:1-deoxy-D-xylulose-5-phosphate reductoisomerase
LAYRALQVGGNAAAVLNAANEIAVEAFLARQLPFVRISDVIEAAMDAVPVTSITTLADVLTADSAGRVAARAALTRYIV